MDDENNMQDGQVGYGRPPKAHQFKKGQSGNPRGRPRKDPGRGAIAHRVLNESQRLSGQPRGARVRVTTFEAVIMALKQLAAAGHDRATALYTTMLARFGRAHTDQMAGFIVIPERLTQEEWEARYSPKDEPPDWPDDLK